MDARTGARTSPIDRHQIAIVRDDEVLRRRIRVQQRMRQRFAVINTRDVVQQLVVPLLCSTGTPVSASHAIASVTSSQSDPSGVLGWAPRSNEDAIVATAESLVRLGLLKS